MEAPLHKPCGTKHWSSQPCPLMSGSSDIGQAQKVERRSPKPKASGSIPETGASAGSSNGRTAPFDGVNAGSTPAPATKFDKVAYQRQYMRDRRAKLKAQKAP